MVIAPFLIAALISGAGAPEPAVGVVGVVRGNVLRVAATATSAHATSAPAVPGEMLGAGDVIETAGSGWVELRLTGGARVRMSAGTRLSIRGERSVRLSSGRIWVLAPERGPLVEIGAPARWAVAERGSSVVAEVAPGRGLTLGILRGGVELAADRDQPAVTVPSRRVARIEGGGLVVVKPGGAALGDLVAAEARDALGDLAGIRAFLLARVGEARVGALDTRGVGRVLRLGPEISGADGPQGWLVEESLRIAPFLEEEVPPKGPNVEVEVNFGGE